MHVYIFWLMTSLSSSDTLKFQKMVKCLMLSQCTTRKRTTTIQKIPKTKLKITSITLNWWHSLPQTCRLESPEIILCKVKFFEEKNVKSSIYIALVRFSLFSLSSNKNFVHIIQKNLNLFVYYFKKYDDKIRRILLVCNYASVGRIFLC